MKLKIGVRYDDEQQITHALNPGMQSIYTSILEEKLRTIEVRCKEKRASKATFSVLLASAYGSSIVQHHDVSETFLTSCREKKECSSTAAQKVVHSQHEDILTSNSYIQVRECLSC